MLKPKNKTKNKTKSKTSRYAKPRSSRSRVKTPRTRQRASAVAPSDSTFRAYAIAAARSADDKKAIDVRVLDLGSNSDLADFLVIAGAESSAQMGAIEQQIEDDLREFGIRPIRRDGRARDRRWLAVDYGNLLIHILMPHARELYRLEQLYENAKEVKWEKSK